MAGGNLKSSYDSTNFVLLDDYKMKFNSLDAGQPEVAVLLSGDTPAVSCVTWKRGVLEESIRFKYIGMDYDTAQNCANAMRSLLTYQKTPWVYGVYLSAGNMLYGWHQGTGTPALDSEIALQKHGTGCMYDVVVEGYTNYEKYTANNYTSMTTNRPLGSVLNSIPGYTSNPVLTGEHFNAAGADNITIVNAPTRKVSFELVGENIYTTKISSDLEMHLVSDNWYKATIDSYAQVRYEGMTKSACKNLFNSLNSTTGWYSQIHPWVLSAYFTQGQTSSVAQLNINWVENQSQTSWQCLNDYKATEDDSGMFTAELMLHSQQTQMTTTPNALTSFSWPSVWSRVPGFSGYL